MTRGPQPLKAQDESLPIAEKRGLVMRYQHRRGNVCEFSIMSPGLISFVCAMRLVRLSSTPEDILHDFAKVIDQLRFIASSPAISRELWLRTPRGAWRFFRVLDDSILELGPDGLPLANGTGPVKVTSPAAGVIPVKKPEPALHTGKKSRKGKRSAAGKDPEPVKNPAPDSIPAQDPEPDKDPVPAAVPEKIAAPVKDTETEQIPAKNPGSVNGHRLTENSAPDSIPAKDSGPKKDRKTATIPEKSPDPEDDPVPAEGPAQAPGPGKIPELIRKFLRRREKGLEKDPESA